MPFRRISDGPMAVFVLVVLTAAAFCVPLIPGPEEPRRATVFQDPGDPVAIIENLPDIVSNDTFYLLNASRSDDPDGVILDYLWQIQIGDDLTELTGKTDMFKFRTLGLYEIRLTVTDNEGNEGMAFTAVYSVSDLDLDGMPDWWEEYYFDDLSNTGGGDFDGDGYTNLQEWVSGTDPTVKDAQPGLVHDLVSNWEYIAIAAVVAVALFAALYPRHKKKQKIEEKKKIEAAIEIEKALEESEK